MKKYKWASIVIGLALSNSANADVLRNALGYSKNNPTAAQLNCMQAANYILRNGYTKGEVKANPHLSQSAFRFDGKIMDGMDSAKLKKRVADSQYEEMANYSAGKVSVGAISLPINTIYMRHKGGDAYSPSLTYTSSYDPKTGVWTLKKEHSESNMNSIKKYNFSVGDKNGKPFCKLINIEDNTRTKDGIYITSFDKKICGDVLNAHKKLNKLYYDQYQVPAVGNPKNRAERKMVKKRNKLTRAINKETENLLKSHAEWYVGLGQADQGINNLKQVDRICRTHSTVFAEPSDSQSKAKKKRPGLFKRWFGRSNR